MGSKWAKNTCWCIPNGPGSLLQKKVFDPFSTHFWSQNGPFSRHFGIFLGPKRVTTGPKWAKNTCLSIPNGPGLFSGKRVFDPFSTHFWSQNGPFSRQFGIFHGPKRVTTGSKRANTCLSIPSGLGTTLEKMIFVAPGTLVDPPLGPAVRGQGCPLAPPSDHRYGGLGVSLGDFEAWKPQKVGGCGWTSCPRNSILSHVAQDTARAWFGGVGAHCADFGASWRLFGPFLGHIVELKGTRGLFDTVKSRHRCSVATISVRLGVLPGFGGYFGREAVFAPKLRRFGRAPPTFCGFGPSELPKRTLRHPYQWSLGGAGGQHSPRTAGAKGGFTTVPGAKKMIFSKVVPRPFGMRKHVFLAHFEPVVTRFGPWKIPKCLQNGPFQDQKRVENGSKTCFSKKEVEPFAMFRQMFLAQFEPIGTGFGPWKIPKCLEKGPFWDQKWVKNGSKTRFSKSDRGP